MGRPKSVHTATWMLLKRRGSPRNAAVNVNTKCNGEVHRCSENEMRSTAAPMVYKAKVMSTADEEVHSRLGRSTAERGDTRRVSGGLRRLVRRLEASTAEGGGTRCLGRSTAP